MSVVEIRIVGDCAIALPTEADIWLATLAAAPETSPVYNNGPTVYQTIFQISGDCFCRLIALLFAFVHNG